MPSGLLQVFLVGLGNLLGHGNLLGLVVQITMKMRTIVRITQIILIIKPDVKHSEKPF